MRLIDADKIDFNEVFVGASDFARDTREAAQSLIDNQPTIEAVPVEHGEWIEFDIDYGGILTVGYQCSECGQSNGFITDFCPNCGADMRKKV